VAISNKGRSVIVLYSSPTSIHSHRARFVLAEKGITCEIIDVDPDNPPEDLIDLNPYQKTLTLVDRDLVLYDAAVITEYLDERYPHPPLMPVDPVSRARLRLAMHRLMNDWYPLTEDIQHGTKKAADSARKQLADALLNSDELFSFADHFLSEDLTLVDCAMAPLLWRLEKYDVTLSAKAKGVAEYCKRVFNRRSFRDCLSEDEKMMRS